MQLCLQACKLKNGCQVVDPVTGKGPWLFYFHQRFNPEIMALLISGWNFGDKFLCGNSFAHLHVIGPMISQEVVQLESLACLECLRPCWTKCITVTLDFRFPRHKITLSIIVNLLLIPGQDVASSTSAWTLSWFLP